MFLTFWVKACHPKICVPVFAVVEVIGFSPLGIEGRERIFRIIKLY